MERIRVNSNVHRIEVNDRGDTIILDLGDANKIEKFSKTTADTKVLLESISDDSAPEKKVEACKVIASMIDEMFGANACMKVFDTECPYPDMIADFFNQINPIATRLIDERNSRMSDKYNIDRKKG